MNKGLEALERVKKFSVLLDSEKDIVKDLVEVIPNTLRTIEKELKALEIIKKKAVNIDDLYACIRTEVYPLQRYNNSHKKITQEEYDLL